MIRASLLALPLCLALILSDASAEDTSGVRVLFVGNSLTYYNDVPELVHQISRIDGNTQQLEVEMLASGGASLAQHLADGHMQRHLVDGNYTFVVFQDIGGWPICPPEFPGCSESVASIEKISKLVLTQGAEPVWYSTYQPIPAMQEALSDEARQIASRLGIRLADVGAAWARYESIVGAGAPFLEDGHPNEVGSLIAAATIFQVITGEIGFSTISIQELCFRQWQGTGLSKASLASRQAAPNQKCESITPEMQQHVLDAANNKGFNRTPESSGPAEPGEPSGGAG